MPFIPRVAGVDFPMFAGGAAISITINSPVNGGFVTDTRIDFQSTVLPLATAQRVVIWEGAIVDGKVPVFDSGVVVQVDNYITVWPMLDNLVAYTARVYAVTITGDRGYADVAFTTNYITAAVPAMVTAKTVGMLGQQDTHVLPRVILEFTPSATGYYAILKSDNGGAYYMIAWLDLNMSRYEDALVCAGHTYRYKVGYNSYRTSPEVFVNFEHAFIHSVPNIVNPKTISYDVDTLDDFVRFESWEHSQNYSADMQPILPAGRQQPTARFGEKLARTYNIRGTTQERTNRELFESVKRLIDRQVKEGRTLCLRLGRDQEMIFGATMKADLAVQQVTTATSIDFTETYYSEEVDLVQADVSAFNYAFRRYTE